MNENQQLTEKEIALNQLILDRIEDELDAKFKEWKAFTFRDRTIDTIIAFTLGMAFSKLATAFSESLIMPFIQFAGKFTGTSWREIVWTPIPNLSFELGKLFAATVDFILMSFVLFILWKIVRHFKKEEEKKEAMKKEARIM